MTTSQRVFGFLENQRETQRRSVKILNMQLSALILCQLAFDCEMINEALEAKGL